MLSHPPNEIIGGGHVPPPGFGAYVCTACGNWTTVRVKWECQIYSAALVSKIVVIWQCLLKLQLILLGILFLRPSVVNL